LNESCVVSADRGGVGRECVPRAAAQVGSPRYPLPAAVESIDGIIRAFYEVVSNAAGVLPERERDASLHAPGAQIRLSRPRRLLRCAAGCRPALPRLGAPGGW
jgi:hypothetical protein